MSSDGEQAAATVAPEPLAAPDLSLLPNVLDDLKKMRSQIGAGAKPVDIPIPGYHGRLLGRFRWVPADELAATAKSLRAIKDPTRQQLAAAADALAATNIEILYKDDAGVPEPIVQDGDPVTFLNGEGLCVALGLAKPTSARECVEIVFGNEYAMVDVATKVMTWLEDTSRNVDEEHLGE